MRNNHKILWVLSLASALLLASCGVEQPSSSSQQPSSDPSSTGEPETSQSSQPGGDTSSDEDPVDNCVITFNSMGGSAVASIEVAFRGRASKPADPTKAGYTFDAWYWDEVCVTPYAWNFRVTSDITLYAGWIKNGSSPSSSADPEQSSSAGPVETLSDWYLVGNGASFSAVWNVSGGVRMNQDPTGANKAVLKGHSFAKDETFKAVKSTDGKSMSDWTGGDSKYATGQNGWKVDTSDNNNIVITTAGTFDVYVTNSGSVWLEKK